MRIATAPGFESYGVRPTSDPTLTPAGAEKALSTADAKQHIQVAAGITVDDTLIDGYVAAAVRWILHTYGVVVLEHTAVFRFDEFPLCGAALQLPRSPVSAVSSIVTYDEDNVASTFAASAYLLDPYSRPARVALNRGQSWPTALRSINAVQVTATVGFGTTAASVPAEVRQAIGLVAAVYYEHRGATLVDPGITLAQLPFGPADLLANWRMW